MASSILSSGLCDHHCHLFLGCPAIEPDALDELDDPYDLDLAEAAHVCAWWQQDRVQQQLKAFADSAVSTFVLQTVSLADFKLHLRVWPWLQQGPLAQRLQLYAGLHPFYVHAPAELQPWLETVSQIWQQQSTLKSTLHSPQLFGLGEVGLDKRQGMELKLQIALLDSLLEATAAWHLPYSFHCVGAHSELLALLKHYPQVTGTVHGFTGSLELAKQYTKRGLHLGLGRALLAPQNQRKYQQLLQSFPQETWHVESDFDGAHGVYDPTLLPQLTQHLTNLSASAKQANLRV